jgi:hypothetical protein
MLCTELVTKNEICDVLQVVNRNGKRQLNLITSIISELEILPTKKEGRVLLYHKSILPAIRRWFWEQFEGELPDVIRLDGTNHRVR